MPFGHLACIVSPSHGDSGSIQAMGQVIKVLFGIREQSLHRCSSRTGEPPVGQIVDGTGRSQFSPQKGRRGRYQVLRPIPHLPIGPELRPVHGAELVEATQRPNVHTRGRRGRPAIRPLRAQPVQTEGHGPRRSSPQPALRPVCLASRQPQCLRCQIRQKNTERPRCSATEFPFWPGQHLGHTSCPAGPDLVTLYDVSLAKSKRFEVRMATRSDPASAPRIPGTRAHRPEGLGQHLPELEWLPDGQPARGPGFRGARRVAGT